MIPNPKVRNQLKLRAIRSLRLRMHCRLVPTIDRVGRRKIKLLIYFYRSVIHSCRWLNRDSWILLILPLTAYYTYRCRLGQDIQ